jgi:hypothetical protein
MKGIFDDWMMNSKSRRDATGGWGWGYDWGWTPGEFLAENIHVSTALLNAASADSYERGIAWAALTAL